MHEFSDRMDPMTVKELRQGMRRLSFVAGFIGIQVVAIAAMVMEFQKGNTAEFTEYTGAMNVWLLGFSGPFWIVVGSICMIVMPLAGLLLMGQELEEGNHELLLLTKVNRWRVVIGKFFTLWSLCALTFLSVLPYVVVRYLVGAVELLRELSCAMTVLGGAAIICAGALGASAFLKVPARIAVFVIFLLSAVAACWPPLYFSAHGTKGCGIFYHLNALGVVVGFVALGLAMARSRLRLTVHAFEVQPSWMVIGLLIFTPLVVGMTTAMTGGFAGFVGLFGMAVVAIYADVTPKAPKWMAAPLPNVPPTRN